MNKKIAVKTLVIAVLFLTVLNAYSIFDLLSNKPALAIMLTILAVLINYVFVNLLYNEISSLQSNRKSIFRIAALFLFSAFMMKSFLIYLCPVSKGIMTIVYGTGWTLFGMGITSIAKYLMLKIRWSPKDLSKFNIGKYLIFCIPSFIVLSAMFIIFFPGLSSGDTVYVWQLVHNNQYNDLHPIMFMLLYKLLSLLWDNIAVVTLFQVVLCSLTFGYVAYYFDRKGLKRIYGIILSILLPLIPANTIYPIILWKDIPYTMGLIIFTIMTIGVLEDHYLDRAVNIIKFILVGLFVLFMRHNAILCIFGSVGLLGLFFLTKKNYKMVLKLGGIFILLVALFFGSKNVAARLLGSYYENSSMLSTKLPYSIQSMQLMYIEHYYGDTFTQEQREKFDKFFNAEGLKQHKEDWGMWNGHGWHWMFYQRPLTLNNNVIAQYNPEFWQLYKELVIEHPIAALEEYQKATGIIWASTSYGPTAYRAYFKSELDLYVNDSHKKAMQPAISWLNNRVLIIYPGFGIIFVRPAFYMVLTLLFCFAGYKRHKFKMLLIVVPAVINAMGYFVVIAAQDVRYFYINYTVAVIAFLYSAMASSDTNKKPTDNY